MGTIFEIGTMLGIFLFTFLGWAFILYVIEVVAEMTLKPEKETMEKIASTAIVFTIITVVVIFLGNVMGSTI